MKPLPLLIALLLAIATTAPAATPGFDTLVNYDTAWTFVYDGGKYTDQFGTVNSINDYLYDVKALPGGWNICLGSTRDSTGMQNMLLVKFDPNGKLLWKKYFEKGGSGHSIVQARSSDLIIGGDVGSAPMVIRLDTAGIIKWATWYYDSVKNQNFLQHSATINCLRETSRGTIICAAGDPYPNNNGLKLSNYAALLEFDSLGRNPYLPFEPCFVSEFYLNTGYNIGGFCVDETKGKNFVLSGNQSVYYTDSLGNPLWRKNYTFMLNGVGSETNNITRAKVLRDNTLMVAGQAYEGNCWTNYQHLYYDAWWSTVDYASGSNQHWDTAGTQGGDDKIFDFTQLNNGNIVFVGVKAYATIGTSTPVWMFLTDSSGTKFLWENIAFTGLANANMVPMSVTATPDNGFTVVGYESTVNTGYDAFAMHFVPKPVSAVSRTNSAWKSTHGFNVHISGARLIILNNAPIKSMGVVSLFDITGKRIASKTVGANLNTPLSFDISKLSFGTYFVRVKSGSAAQTMKFVKER